MNASDFRAAVAANPLNTALIDRLGTMGLAQCHLAAGCLFQTVWNRISGNAPDWGIKDYDVFYFDDEDLSWDAEDRVIQRVNSVVCDLSIKVEVKNQARVHLWYRDRFKSDYPQLTSTRAGIDLYLVSCTCVGIDVQTGDLYAPDGFEDLAAGILKINPRNPKPELFQQKAETYQQRWPWLTIVD